MIRYFTMLGGALLATVLVACGGGGGSPGTTGGTQGPVTTPTTITPTVVVSVVDAQGAPVSSISVSGGFSAKAIVKDSTGSLVPNKLVTFSVSGSSIAVLNPDTAITDSSGVAQVSIAPASINSLGAATLKATATIDGNPVIGSKDFSVSATNLTMSDISVGTANLASGGNTSLGVTVLINGTAATTPVNVTFSASCGRINGVAGSFGTTTNGSGVASAVYTAVAGDGSLCTGPVTVTAASSGATPKSTVITVAPPVANAITFVSATPEQIYVAGSGALEQSVVKFKVLSGSTPLANVAVRFSIQVNPGGVGLNSTGSSADVVTTTDSTGIATVSVFSGTLPGPVRVRAQLEGNSAVFAETQNLTVASGPPSQRFMSLSVETFNIEGWDLDGTATTLTVRLADRQGNAVVDGTVVNFTAEGGQVASSCATHRVNGISSCSVEFRTQNPRPAGGRVSVLAFTSGTKDYVDVNANNLYDPGVDTLVNIGDAYRDDNENAAFDAGEFVIPRGGAVACAGSGWPFPARANTCDAGLATTVRQQAVLLFASSDPIVNLTTLNTAFISVNMGSADNPLLPMPAGTTATWTTADATPGNQLACSINTSINTAVPNIGPNPDLSASMQTTHSATLSNCATGDIILLTVKAPSGLQTLFQYTLP